MRKTNLSTTLHKMSMDKPSRSYVAVEIPCQQKSLPDGQEAQPKWKSAQKRNVSKRSAWQTQLSLNPLRLRQASLVILQASSREDGHLLTLKSNAKGSKLRSRRVLKEKEPEWEKTIPPCASQERWFLKLTLQNVRPRAKRRLWKTIRACTSNTRILNGQ